MVFGPPGCGAGAFVEVEGPVEVVWEGWVRADIEADVEGVWGESCKTLGLFLFDVCGFLSCFGTRGWLGHFDNGWREFVK